MEKSQLEEEKKKERETKRAKRDFEKSQLEEEKKMRKFKKAMKQKMKERAAAENNNTESESDDDDDDDDLMDITFTLNDSNPENAANNSQSCYLCTADSNSIETNKENWQYCDICKTWLCDFCKSDDAISNYVCFKCSLIKNSKASPDGFFPK